MATEEKSKSKKRQKASTLVKKEMPKWEKSPRHLVELFNATMSTFPEATTKKMFGCPCAFVNGNMASGLFADLMFVRLDADNGAELLKTQGARPFEPLPGRPMHGYLVVPDSVRESEQQLKLWIGKAVEYTSSLPRKPKR